MTKEEKIKIAIEKGFIYNPINGKVYSKFNHEINTISTNGYIRVYFYVNKKQIYVYAHQFAWYWVNNEIVDHIDHRNGIKIDNRIINLRSITNQENHFNRTTAKGYTWDSVRNKWIAQIKVNGKRIYLGSFILEEDARNSYLEAKKEYHKINK